MTVLTTTGVQSEAHLPFAGLHQLLRPVRDRAAELPAVQRAALDAAFGLTNDAAPEHFRIAMATLDLVAEVATEAPLLLLIEDVHWLDRPTANVLAFVARRLESDPILLLAAARDGYPSVLSDVGLPEVRLARLDAVTAGALLDASAPELPLALRGRVLREAAGNPLALLELPAVMSRAGGRAMGRGRAAVDRAARARLRARVSELPEASRLVLLVAALSDEDRLDEIVTAASVIAGCPDRSRRRGSGSRCRRSSTSTCIPSAFGIRSSARPSRRAPAWAIAGASTRRWRIARSATTGASGTALRCSPVSTRMSQSSWKRQACEHGSGVRSRSR